MAKLEVGTEVIMNDNPGIKMKVELVNEYGDYLCRVGDGFGVFTDKEITSLEELHNLFLDADMTAVAIASAYTQGKTNYHNGVDNLIGIRGLVYSFYPNYGEFNIGDPEAYLALQNAKKLLALEK